MSDPPTRRAPPGWYSEQGQRDYRYWDGQSWAESRGEAVGYLGARPDGRTSQRRQRTGLVFMGSAVALLTAGLLLPWAQADSGDRGALDGEIPWLLGLGSVADSWLLILVGAVMLWALLTATLAGSSARMWLAAVVVGLAVMGFCVAEGLAIDNDLDVAGARVGRGLFVAYAGGASAAIGGALLRPAR